MSALRLWLLIVQLADVHKVIVQAIADLKAAGIPVPASLRQAAHALSLAVASGQDMPACNGQGHTGAL
jgi:hypothetical protein